MPKIQWAGLPAALHDHLFDRLRERKITAEDLYQLKEWRESDPDAPDGLWRPSCLQAKQPKGRSYDGSLVCATDSNRISV